MRLGTILLRDAVITLSQLEQALRAQILNGGRLGTNLVELEFLEINTLSRYLARILDTPLAIADRFEKADPKLIEEFGAEMADRHCAIPLGLDPDAPDSVFVALSDPTNYKSISAIEKHLKRRVTPLVAAELRLFYYLEYYYRIHRRARFRREPEAENARTSSRRERRVTQPFRGISTPGIVSIAPRQRRPASTDNAPAPRPAKLRSFHESCDEVEQSTERQGIADAILRFTIGRFECAALFIVRSMNAIGWRAQALGLGEDALERLSLPLGGSSIFQAAHDSGKAYRGKSMLPGNPLERELWSHFALEHEPDDLHVVPVTLHGAVINLIYAHGFAGHTTPDHQHEELCQLAIRASHAYRRLMAKSVNGS